MKTVYAVSLSLLIGACAAPSINYNDPAAVAQMVKTSRDDFKKEIWWNGPSFSTPKPNVTSTNVFLRAFRHDGGAAFYQVYVSDEFLDDWRYYAEIYDADGKKIEATKIAQKVDSCTPSACWMHEDVAANVSRDYLQAHATNGLKLQVSGRGGKVVVSVPPGYVQAFLNAVPKD